jgi:hypothetical protein
MLSLPGCHFGVALQAKADAELEAMRRKFEDKQRQFDELAAQKVRCTHHLCRCTAAEYSLAVYMRNFCRA